MTRAYYNEIEPYAAEWLRNLIAAGHIAPGDVDTRSIEDVTPNDLRGYTQCHFFAGIAGWSLALRLAGWPDGRPVWTGSCPCQPFSEAGERGGFADERHLWPAWFHLIDQCRPQVVFGEQVEKAIAFGWLDLVQDDMEGVGYAVAPIVLPASGLGAPHIRHRLWWVADSSGARPLPGALPGVHRAEEGAGPRNGEPQRRGATGAWGRADWLHHDDGKARPVEPGSFPLAHGVPNRMGRIRAYGNAIVPEVAAEVIAAFMECQDECRSNEVPVSGMQVLPFNPARVTKAAIRSRGYIWTGWRHADILAEMRASGVDRIRCQTAEQGFQTTLRSFVGRDEALTVAVGAGQIDYRNRPPVLLSEHLWDAEGVPLE